MKITKKLREEAALCCQLAASNEWDLDQYQEQFTWDDDAAELADEACVFVINHDWSRVLTDPSGVWAEAESLLRTGWMP